MENKQLTPEELSKANSFKDEKDFVVWKLGEIAVAQLKLKVEQEQLEKRYLNVQAESEQFLDSLIDKYGEGSISLETGVFTPRN